MGVGGWGDLKGNICLHFLRLFRDMELLGFNSLAYVKWLHLGRIPMFQHKHKDWHSTTIEISGRLVLSYWVFEWIIRLDLNIKPIWPVLWCIRVNFMGRFEHTADLSCVMVYSSELYGETWTNSRFDLCYGVFEWIVWGDLNV